MTIFGRFGWETRGLWKGGHTLRQKHCIKNPTSTLAPSMWQETCKKIVDSENISAPTALTTQLWSATWQDMSRSTQAKSHLLVFIVLTAHMRNQRSRDTWGLICNCLYIRGASMLGRENIPNKIFLCDTLPFHTESIKCVPSVLSSTTCRFFCS